MPEPMSPALLPWSSEEWSTGRQTFEGLDGAAAGIITSLKIELLGCQCEGLLLTQRWEEQEDKQENIFFSVSLLFRPS